MPCNAKIVATGALTFRVVQARIAGEQPVVETITNCVAQTLQGVGAQRVVDRIADGNAGEIAAARAVPMTKRSALQH